MGHRSLLLLSLRIGALVGLCGAACLSAADDKSEPPRARVIAEPVSYPEGPCFLDGKLYFTEYGAHAVNVWDGKRTRRFWSQEKSGPSAILPMPDGQILVTLYDANTLALLGPEGKTVLTITRDSCGRPFNGPNDLVRDERGGVYFSASGRFEPDAPVEGKVYYITPCGAIWPVAVDVHYPNGLAITDGGKTLLVAEHLRKRILKCMIRPDGFLTDCAVWKRLSDIQPEPKGADWATGPDGLKTDSRGNIYICQAGASRILVTKPDGSWLRTIPVPYPFVTNVAFSPEEATLYVTAVKDVTKEPHPGAVFAIPNR